MESQAVPTTRLYLKKTLSTPENVLIGIIPRSGGRLYSSSGTTDNLKADNPTLNNLIWCGNKRYYNQMTNW